MTGSPKRPWRTTADPVTGVLREDPVSYTASPGPKSRIVKHPTITPYVRDLLSAMHAVRLGIPLSDRGRSILYLHLRNALAPAQVTTEEV